MKFNSTLLSLSHFIVLLLLLGFTWNIGAQTTLGPGDIAFTSFSSDAPDQFSFVLLKDVTAGTTFVITDDEFDGTNLVATATSSEGRLRVTFTNAFTCGSEFSLVSPSGTGGDFPNGAGYTLVEESVFGTTLQFSTSGDALIAFQDANSNTTSPATFIAALNNSGSPFGTANTPAGNTQLPTGLVVGQSAVAIDNGGTEFDNVRYLGSAPSSGTPTQLAQAINTRSNWEGSDVTYGAPLTYGFNCQATCIDPTFNTGLTQNPAGNPCPTASVNILIDGDLGTNTQGWFLRTGSAIGPIIQGPAVTSLFTISGIQETTTYFVTAAFCSGPGQIPASITITSDTEAPTASSNNISTLGCGIILSTSTGRNVDDSGNFLVFPIDNSQDCATEVILRTPNFLDNCGVDSVAVTFSTGSNAIQAPIQFPATLEFGGAAGPIAYEAGEANFILPAILLYPGATGPAETVVTFTVFDAAGLSSSSCSYMIQVTDNEPATAICKNDTVFLDANGMGTLLVSDIDDGSFDNCGLGTLSLSQTSFDCNDVTRDELFGTNTPINITLTATDVAGNMSSCISAVTVLDTIAPTATCSDVTINLDANGNASFDLFASGVITNQMDNCGVENAIGSSILSDLDCDDLGSQQVTISQFDVNGNEFQCAVTLTVADPLGVCNQPPSAGPARVGIELPTSGGVACPESATVSASIGDVLAVGDVISIGGIDVPVPNATEVTDDTDSPASLIVNVANIVVTPTRCTTQVEITYIVEDSQGAMSDPRTDVILIIDNTPPYFGRIQGVADPVVDASCMSPTFDYRSEGGVPVTDNCGGTVVFTQTPAPGTMLGVGTFTVTHTVTDECGNTDSHTFDVTNVDNTPPEINCPSSIVVDGCSTADILNGGMTALPVSTTSLSISETQFNAEGGIVSDNCGINTLEYIDVVSGTSCNITISRTFTATDINSNSSVSCSVQIVIQDDTDPLVTAPAAVTINCDDDATNLALTGMAVATDNCSTAPPPMGGATPVLTPFINEIHYDNIGGDTGEGVEIAGTAGTDLSGYTLQRYNGSNGSSYGTTTLSGSIPDEGNGFGALWFPIAGLQNGAPDGVALCGPMGVLEFISYEGFFTASDGCADGITSANIGVEESNTSTAIGQSLQRTGMGGTASGFMWAGPTTASPGSLNAGQTLVAQPADGEVATVFSDVNTPGTCIGEQIITRTFLAADDCGNTATATQLITVTDTEGPTFTTPAGSLDAAFAKTALASVSTGPCADDIDLVAFAATALNGGPAFFLGTLPVATENCSPQIIYTATASLGATSNSCVAIVEVEIFAEDVCGNAAAAPFLVTFTITGDGDAILPMNPAPVTLLTSAGADCLMPFAGLNSGDMFAPGASITIAGQPVALPTVAEIMGCVGPNPMFIVTGVASSVGANPCITNLSVDFDFNSDCGTAGPLSFTLSAELIDDTAPVVLAPANTTITCLDDSNDLTLTGEATATDNCTPLLTSPLMAAGQIFINEFHYSNTGTDVGEFIEIAGPAGTNLSGYNIELVNGNGGTVYNTLALSGIIPDEGAGFGAIAFLYPSNGIQNGAPDGISLCGPNGIIEFLSYEGAVTADLVNGGCASGLTSTNVLVEESDNEPVGVSLQRTGTGLDGRDFAFVGPLSESPGILNAGQVFQTSPAGPSGGMVAVTFFDNVIPGACSAESTIQRTWEAVDACGNTATALQIITVVDPTPPVFDQAPGALDNTISTTELAADGFGNCAVQFDITNLPTNLNFALIFGQTNFGGIFELPTATDDCALVTVQATRVSIVNVTGLAPCSAAIEVTYTATNDCGRMSTYVSTLTIIDNEAPILDTGFTTDLTIECDMPFDVATTGEPTFTDNCGTSIAPVSALWINEFHYDNSGGDLNEFVEVAGTAGIDLAGYSLEFYNGSDGSLYRTTLLTGILPDQGQGGGALSFFLPTNGIQNGSPDGIALIDPAGLVVEFISYEGVLSASNGAAAGMTSTDIGVFEDENTLPTQSLQRVGAGSMASAFVFAAPSEASPGMLNVNQIYLSSQTVNVSFSESSIPDPNCVNGQTITREWTADDGCGNSAVATQTITVVDTQGPVFDIALRAWDVTNVDLNSSFSTGLCLTALDVTEIGDAINAGLAAGATSVAGLPIIFPTSSDACGGPITTTAFTLVSPNATNCQATILLFYTATDACGNSSDYVQRLFVTDVAPPVLTVPAPNVTVECDMPTDVAATGSPVFEDECIGAIVTITNADVEVADPNCPNGKTITRTFTAVDPCGNTSIQVQTITVVDTEAPVYTSFPRDTTVECSSLSGMRNEAAIVKTVADARGFPTVEDNCSTGLLAPFTDVFTLSTNCPTVGIYERIFAPIDDGCGNILPARTLTITVIDTMKPIFTSIPIGGDFDCTVGIPPVGTATAVDCDPNVVVTEVDDETIVGVNQVVSITERTITARDFCGNETSQVETYRVLDQVGPFLLSCPSDIGPIVARPDDRATVSFATPVFDDNCSFSVSGTHASGEDFPVGLTQVTYTAIDGGGNITICEFTIEVVKALNLTCLDHDISIDNAADLTRADINFPYAATDCDACPQGEPLPSLDYLGYFRGHRYYTSVAGDTRSWTEAQRHAVSLGGRLVEVNSAEENLFLQRESPHAQALIGHFTGPRSTTWTGTFSPVIFENWATGFPTTGTNEFFALLSSADGTHTNANHSEMPYIVEFPCVEIDVIGMTSDSLFGQGIGSVTYSAVDLCGNRDTCEYTIGINTFDVVYCTPFVESFGGEEDYYITGVEVNAFAKTFDASSIYLHTRDTIELDEDSANSFSFSAETSGVEAGAFPAYWRVWVDANQDGDFYDAGELIHEVFGDASATGTLDLPSALQSVSPTRIRVAFSRYGYPEACGDNPFGDIKDFSLISNTVRAPRLMLAGARGIGQHHLTTSSEEDPEIASYLMLRGASADDLTKIDFWDALYGDGNRHTYELADTDPAISAYYQAVALDDQGFTVRSSNIVHLTMPTRRGPVRVFPNPAYQHVDVELGEVISDLPYTPVKAEPNGELHLFDALGRIVQTQSFAGDAARVRMQLPQLATGTYMLRVTRPNTQPETVRVMIDQSGGSKVPRA